MLHCHSCRLALFKDQILVFLEGHNFKQSKGELIHTWKHLWALWPHLFHISFSCTEMRHKKTMGQDPTRCEGCPWHEPKFRMSEDLYHMTKTQCNEVLKSSYGFSELSRWHSLKAIGAARQDETNTAGTWRRLNQGVILAGKQGKILRHCVYGVKKISSSFS